MASAHGGGLDAQGGHRDRKANNYHFHQGPLDGNTYASKEAAARALEAYDSGEQVTVDSNLVDVKNLPELSAKQEKDGCWDDCG